MSIRIPIYQVDAFAGRVFAGNPAAVCPLEDWLPDATMQAVAAENNLSETAFFRRGDGGHVIRWFTPAVEVDLCGHATLASGFVVMTQLDRGAEHVVFDSASGPLRVTRAGELFSLDFPARRAVTCTPPAGLIAALGAEPREMLEMKGRYFAVYGDPGIVRGLAPDMAALAQLAPQGIAVTAPDREHDFVSRFFAPSKGIPEDPVTGATHTVLIPYWAARLGKTDLRAVQASSRGGELSCRARGDRVDIAGRAVLYMEGTIHL